MVIASFSGHSVRTVSPRRRRNDMRRHFLPLLLTGGFDLQQVAVARFIMRLFRQGVF